MLDNIISLEPCENCGGPIKNTWKYCPYCRSTVEKGTCIYCYKEIKSRWKFCPYCRRRVKNLPNGKESFNEVNDWLQSVLETTKKKF